MRLILFVAMEDSLKKMLRTGIHSLISITEEVRYGLTVLEKDINQIIEKAEKTAPGQVISEPLRQVVDKSIDTLQKYREKALEMSAAVQKYLQELDPLGKQKIDELSEKLDHIAKSIKK